MVDKTGALRRFTAGVLPALAGRSGGPRWPGADIARGVALLPHSKGGYVVDLFGALHPFSVGSHARPPLSGHGPTFGSDAARGVALMPNGKGGYVLDLFGGIHRFSVGSGPLAPATHGAPVFHSDAARGIAILPDGSGGYIVDLFGALHPFGIGANARPSVTPTVAVTPGQDRARGLAFINTTQMTSSSLRAAEAAAAGPGVAGDGPEGPRRVIAAPVP